MKNDELRKVQLFQFELAKKIKEICEENGIKYFIIAGTLLGAVRHKGFIPWDDDLDVGMLREDYEKFLKVCPQYLDSELLLQTWENEEEFPGPFAKLRLKNTLYVEKNSQHSNINKGIYVDIFPFDNVPESRFCRFLQKWESLLYTRLLIAKCGYTPWSDKELVKKLCYKFLNLFSRLFSYVFLHECLNKCMKRYNSKICSNITTFGGAYGYDHETIKRKWIENVNDIQFEDGTLSAPVLYDEYLSYFYGDYMTPPPEHKRGNRHLIVELDFGELLNKQK